MAKIPTILQGDTAAAITITLASNYDFSGATLEATYQGNVKTFTGLTAGGTVSLSYAAAETMAFSVRTDFVHFRILKGSTVYTLPLSVKIRVTDCPADVYTGTVSIAPATLPTAAADGDSLGELKVKFNAVLTALRNAGIATCITLAFVAQGALMPTNTLNDVSGTNTIYDIVSASGVSVGGSSGSAASSDTARGLVSSNGAGVVKWDSSASEWKVNGSARFSDNLYAPYVYLNVLSGTDLTGGHIQKLFNDGSTEDVVYGISTNGASALHGDVSLTLPPDTSDSVAALAVTSAAHTSTISTWAGYWSGDDFRVTITNYDSLTHLPALYMEDKRTAGGTNYFRKVWDERTRWDAFLGPLNLETWDGFYSWETNITAELTQKADRAWGFYDSHTGEWAPEGYTQISSSNILISSGMSYQRTLTTQGSVWVLTAHGAGVQTGGLTNGFFRISDDEGNGIFEIVKGTKREVGADAAATSTREVDGLTYMTVAYNVVSAEHPTMYYARSLGEDSTWYAETDAACPVTTSWTGASGNWTNEFHYTSANVATNALFAKAGYIVGGETRIKQSVPVDMQYIILGGQKYRLGTATISGSTVLTLTAVN